jgi:tRNA pseudouridine55 synthase
MRSGLVVVDKPAGCTSHDVVARLRKIYGQRRVGHAGTLDPDATGVLLVGLGRVTRLLRFLTEAGKVYRGTVGFGIATDTLDAAGRVLERDPMPLTRGEVEDAARRFVGDVLQVPPMVSAVKVGGRRLHEIARAGEEIEREARLVHIARIEVEGFDDGPFPHATLLVECASGTYIRTLAADLGAALGGPAHLVALRRLAVGAFTLDDARTLAEIEADPDGALLSPAAAMRGLEPVVATGETAAAVRHGATFPARVVLPAAAGPGPFAVVDGSGELLAVYERRGSGVKPAVVIAADG